MSIQEELEKVTGVKKGRHSDQEHAQNLVDKISELNDNDWAKLSKGAQAWFNEAVDALNDNHDAPAFPEEEKTTTRRGATKAKEETKGAWVPKSGDLVVVTTKRNKVYEGEFMELDGDVAVVKVDGEEMEFTADRTASMVPALPIENDNSGKPEEGADLEPQVGDFVTLTTKRNAVITGNVVEITDEVVVLDVDGKEAEYDRARVASIVVETDSGPDGEDAGNDDAGNDDAPPVVGDYIKAVTKRNKEVEGKVVEIDENILIIDVDGADVEVDMDTAKSLEIVKDEVKATGRSRRGATDEKKGAAKPEEKKTKTTKADNGGVSVGLRMRQVICENPDDKVEAINKLLEKEGLSFKEATLKIVYKDVHVVFDLLKKLKHWK